LFVSRIQFRALTRKPPAIQAIDLGLDRELDRPAAAWKLPLRDETVDPLEKFFIQRNGDFGGTHVSSGMTSYHTASSFNRTRLKTGAATLDS
jgi:hypothetical protein